MERLIKIKCIAIKLIKEIPKNLIFKILNLFKILKEWKAKAKMMTKKANLRNINNNKK
jgi:hypothetical protein